MSTQKTLGVQAWSELFLLSAVWGGIFLAYAIALRELGVFTIVTHRVFWAAVVLWVIVLVRRLDIPTSPSMWAALLVMGALNNVIPFSLIAWGQTHIESGLASVFNAMTAFFGALFAAIVFQDERLTANKAVGIGLGICGVVIAIGWQALTHIDVRSLSQLAILASGVSYGLASVWARKHLGGLHPVVAAAGMLTGSTVLAAPLAFALEGSPIISMSAPTIGALAYSALAGTVVAYILYYRVLNMAGSGNLMLCTLLIPPIAIVLGAVVLSESLQPNVYLGLAVIAAGLVILDGRAIRRLKSDLSI